MNEQNYVEQAKLELERPLRLDVTVRAQAADARDP